LLRQAASRPRGKENSHEKTIFNANRKAMIQRLIKNKQCKTEKNVATRALAKQRSIGKNA